MSELKTTPSKLDVQAFINSVKDEHRREDCTVLLSLMEQITEKNPVMWGKSIVGFGSYHYKYASGREGDWMLTGFSPRKQNLTIYILSGFDQFQGLLQKLGKHKTSVSCLYINKLSDVDRSILSSLIAESVDIMKKNT